MWFPVLFGLGFVCFVNVLVLLLCVGLCCVCVFVCFAFTLLFDVFVSCARFGLPVFVCFMISLSGLLFVGCFVCCFVCFVLCVVALCRVFLRGVVCV